MMVSITCPTGNTTLGVCTLFEELGAGFGIMLQYLAASLPYLLVVLAAVTIFVGLFGAVSSVIRSHVTKGK